MIWIPLELLPKHHEETASWWRQLLGMSYVWWALAAIVVVGLTTASRATSPRRSPGSAPVADPPARKRLFPVRPAQGRRIRRFRILLLASCRVVLQGCRINVDVFLPRQLHKLVDHPHR